MASLHFTTTPIFNTIRNTSIKIMAKVSEESAASCRPPLKLTVLPRRRQEHLVSVLSEAEDLFTILQRKLTNFVSTLESKGQTVEELKGFLGSITRFTDESLESFGRNVSELLTEITHQMQELEKDLDKAKASGRVCSSIFSVIVGVITAVVGPVVGLVAAPFLPCFGQVWNDVVERPIEDKLNDLRAIQFIIHSAILEVGKIQEAVYGINGRMTNHPYAQQEGVNVGYLDSKPINHSIRVALPEINMADDSSYRKAKGQLDEKEFRFRGTALVSSDSNIDFKKKDRIEGLMYFNGPPSLVFNDSEMKELSNGGKDLAYSFIDDSEMKELSNGGKDLAYSFINDSSNCKAKCLPFRPGKMQVNENFWIRGCASSAFKEKGMIKGGMMTNIDLKMKKPIDEGDNFHLVPFFSEVGVDGEVGKSMVAAIAQVEMAKHELSQIIHSVTLSL